MPKKPFIDLICPRDVADCNLPPQLAVFYSHHEGIGEAGNGLSSLRLFKLREIRMITWADLNMASGTPVGWEQFRGLTIAQGSYFEQIIYVIKSPACPSGSILAIGNEIVGPGGYGPFQLENSIVLAPDYSSWISHIELWNWQEPILGHNMDITDDQQRTLLEYYRSLNSNLITQ